MITTRFILFLIQFLLILPHNAVFGWFGVITSTRYTSPEFDTTTKYFRLTNGLLVVVNVLLHQKQDSENVQEPDVTIIIKRNSEQTTIMNSTDLMTIGIRSPIYL